MIADGRPVFIERFNRVARGAGGGSRSAGFASRSGAGVLAPVMRAGARESSGMAPLGVVAFNHGAVAVGKAGDTRMGGAELRVFSVRSRTRALLFALLVLLALAFASGR